MSRERDLLLELLRERYGERWAIRRSEHLWIATANDPDADHAPTLVQPDLDTFVGELEAPPPRAGGPCRSLMAASLFAENVERVTDGVYYISDPPGC